MRFRFWPLIITLLQFFLSLSLAAADSARHHGLVFFASFYLQPSGLKPGCIPPDVYHDPLPAAISQHDLSVPRRSEKHPQKMHQPNQLAQRGPHLLHGQSLLVSNNTPCPLLFLLRIL
jgi:hypothetical protein